MIVWRVVGDEIGNGGSGAAYFATKAEALQAASDWHDGRDTPRHPPAPEKLTIITRDDLAWQLNEATGYGAT